MHLAADGRLDEDVWIDELLELDGAIELGAELEIGVLDAALEVAGEDELASPPPQAANKRVMQRWVIPVANLIEYFIRTPGVIIVLILVINLCNRLQAAVYRCATYSGSPNRSYL